MIRRLIILLLIVGCGTEPEDVVIPSPSVICENNYSEVDGSLVSCGTGCIESDVECYLQNEIVLKGHFDPDFIGGKEYKWFNICLKCRGTMHCAPTQLNNKRIT